MLWAMMMAGRPVRFTADSTLNLKDEKKESRSSISIGDKRQSYGAIQRGE